MATLELIIDDFKKNMGATVVPLDSNKPHERYSFRVDDFDIKIEQIEGSILFHCPIEILPSIRQESLIEHVMAANFLGQGTGGAKIGLDSEEKFLTLSYIFDYDINYRAFVEKLEEFVNYLAFWHKTIHNWNSGQDH